MEIFVFVFVVVFLSVFFVFVCVFALALSENAAEQEQKPAFLSGRSIIGGQLSLIDFFVPTQHPQPPSPSLFLRQSSPQSESVFDADISLPFVAGVSVQD